MTRIDRKQFLRLGATSAGTALIGGGALAATAGAALPSATPQGDDVGFVQLGAIGERISHVFYRDARLAPVLSGPERRRAAAARDAKARQYRALNAALGEDALGDDDFAIELPQRAFVTREALATLGRDLEALLVGLYLNGVQNAQDPATRLLLGRMLTYDTQQLTWLRALLGRPNQTDVPAPVGVEDAGARLDAFLSTPGIAPS